MLPRNRRVVEDKVAQRRLPTKDGGLPLEGKLVNPESVFHHLQVPQAWPGLSGPIRGLKSGGAAANCCAGGPCKQEIEYTR